MTLPSPSFYHSLTLDDIFQVWWGGRPVAHGHHWRSSPQKSPRSELDITSGLHIYNALPSHFFSVVTLLLCDTASQCCARGRYLIYKAGRRRSGEGMGIRMVSGGEGGPDGAREVRRHALSLCCGQSHCSCFCVLCTTVTSPSRPRSSHGHHHDDHSCHGGVHSATRTLYYAYTVHTMRQWQRVPCTSPQPRTYRITMPCNYTTLEKTRRQSAGQVQGHCETQSWVPRCVERCAVRWQS